MLLLSKPIQRIYQHFLSRLQTKERVLRVNKSKITGEDTLNEDNFGIKGNQESSKDEKFCFGIF